jgi:lipopolysaccharide export system protein LptA
MLKRSFIISLGIALLVLAPLAASAAPKPQVKGPITITSETLTADNKAHTALFEKNVVAKTPNMTLYADSMLVFYTEKGGNVTKIEATGNVRLYKDTRVITSQKATYFADQDKVVFTGGPRAVDGENVVTGTTMTYFIAEDRSYVEHGKVILKNGGAR